MTQRNPAAPSKTEVIPECPHCNSSDITVIDEWAGFKDRMDVLTLLTKDNEHNLSKGYLEDRASTLTEMEERVFLWAEWAEVNTTDRFIPDMALYDACHDPDLPPLTLKEPMVICLDASVRGDCFALVGVTEHPKRPGDVAVRYMDVWEPKGNELDYLGSQDEPGPERILRWLCRRDDPKALPKRKFIESNVAMVTYDEYQLHYMMTGIKNEGFVWCDDFSQGNKRLESDRALLDMILQREFWHNGHPKLREHFDNADRKLDTTSRKLRIVKRMQSRKIDLCVATAMAAYMLKEHFMENVVRVNPFR